MSALKLNLWQGDIQEDSPPGTYVHIPSGIRPYPVIQVFAHRLDTTDYDYLDLFQGYHLKRIERTVSPVTVGYWFVLLDGAGHMTSDTEATWKSAMAFHKRCRPELFTDVHASGVVHTEVPNVTWRPASR